MLTPLLELLTSDIDKVAEARFNSVCMQRSTGHGE
jgi:hypothetical protein